MGVTEKKLFSFKTKIASELYETYLKDLPAIDLCASLGSDILLKDTPFSNISELWFCQGSEKNKAFEMAGCEEKYINGNVSDYEKFREFCRILSSFIGNPIYTACHFELSFFFECELEISEANCDAIWHLTSDKLLEKPLTVLDIVKKAGIKKLFIESPINSDISIYEKSPVKEYLHPLFSADDVLDIATTDAKKRLAALGKEFATEITDINSFTEFLKRSIDTYSKSGAELAIHRIDSASFDFVTPNEYKADLVLKKAIFDGGESLTKEEFSLFRAEMIYILAAEYKKRGWGMILSFDRAYEANRLLPYLKKKGVLPMTLISLKDGIFAPDDGFCGNTKQMIANTSVTKNRLRQTAERSSLATFISPPSEAKAPLELCHHALFRCRLAALMGELTEEGICPPKRDLIGENLKRIALQNTEDIIQK